MLLGWFVSCCDICVSYLFGYVGWLLICCVYLCYLFCCLICCCVVFRRVGVLGLLFALFCCFVFVVVLSCFAWFAVCLLFGCLLCFVLMVWIDFACLFVGCLFVYLLLLWLCLLCDVVVIAVCVCLFVFGLACLLFGYDLVGFV